MRPEIVHGRLTDVEKPRPLKRHARAQPRRHFQPGARIRRYLLYDGPGIESLWLHQPRTGPQLVVEAAIACNEFRPVSGSNIHRMKSFLIVCTRSGIEHALSVIAEAHDIPALPGENLEAGHYSTFLLQPVTGRWPPARRQG